MQKLIDSSLLDDHDLYHARYGRGAVIVAVRKDPDGTTKPDINSRDRQLARHYNERGPGNLGGAPDFEPIQSIEEEGGFVRVIVRFTKPHPVYSYPYATATIERVIPVDQVTLEIVRASDFPPLPNRRSFR